MATGFDRRQSTRDSFAFQTNAPAQGRPAASGQSRSAQIVGGQSQGGAVAAGPQTDATPVAAGLGAYVAQIMEPHVKARQAEEFFKGFTKAQEGVALDELDKGGGLTTKIFGSTAFEQGAQFFTAKKALDDWNTSMLQDLDTLKKMRPEEVSKLLAERSQALMTGHQGADGIIQSGLVELAGPLMNTVAKARDGYLQETFTLTYNQQAVSSATNLQKLGEAQAKLSAPTENDNSAMQSAVAGFLGSIQQPEGMHDEVYKTSLFNLMRSSMQDGNFFAVEALRRAGVDKVFDEDEQVKLQNAYERYGNKLVSRAAMGHVPDLLRLDADMARTEMGGHGPSAMEAAGRLADINNAIKRETGVDLDLFDYQAVRATGGKVVDTLIASYKRAEDRRWQIEDRDQKRQWDLEDKEREEQQQAAQVTAMWAMGSVKTGIAAGMKANDFDVLAINDYRSGNFASMVRAYTKEGWISSDVQSMAQARITSSLGQQYSKDFEQGHKEWATINKANPATAMAYYDKYYVPMQKYDSLVRSGGYTPQQAYITAFGDPGAYSVERIDPERRKDTEKGVKAYVQSKRPWFGTGLNTSSSAAKVNALTNEVAIQANNSDIPTDVLVKNVERSLFASGKAEEYGQFFWRTPPGTPPLSKLLKLQPQEATTVIVDTIDKRLKAVGFKEGASGDNYVVRRFNDDKGQPALSVQGMDDDGDFHPPVLIRLGDLQAAATHKRQEAVQANQPSQASFAARQAAQQGLDPNRRIAGEKGWQRVYRINLETKARSDLNRERRQKR